METIYDEYYERLDSWFELFDGYKKLKLSEAKDIAEKIKKTTNPNEKYWLEQEAKSLEARYLPMFQMIPNKKHQPLSLTYRTRAFLVEYDRIVVDTYDYLDKLIGFRLGDAFFAAFDKYFMATADERAEKMCKYIRYGTNDPKEIMLLRYGFDYEDFDWIKDLVTHIDENEMVLSSTETLTEDQLRRIQKFI